MLPVAVEKFSSATSLRVSDFFDGQAVDDLDDDSKLELPSEKSVLLITPLGLFT